MFQDKAGLANQRGSPFDYNGDVSGMGANEDGGGTGDSLSDLLTFHIILEARVHRVLASRRGVVNAVELVRLRL